MNVFIDSDILIEVLRARDQEIQARWLSLRSTEVAILYSPVSVAEVWAGARPNEYEQTARLFRPLLCSPIDHAIGELAGQYMRLYAKSHSLEVSDALIAASAVHNHTQLWTRNHKHYPMPELSFY